MKKLTNTVGVLRNLSLYLGTAAAALVLCGCQTYQQRNHALQFYRNGDYVTAEKEAAKSAKRNLGKKDEIISYLELGTIERASGKYEDSNAAFQTAEDKIKQYDAAAKVKVASEGAALLSNQDNLPYRGRAYDKIMLSTYKGLNYLSLGDIDKARVELNNAYLFQQDAVEENKRALERSQESLDQEKEKDKIAKAQEDPKFKEKLGNSYSDLDQMKVYADYVNPFTVYLDGLFHLGAAADASDLDRARKSFERALSYAPDNKFLKLDLASAEEVASGKALSPTTYVIFEAGEAPERDQIRIDIPVVVGPVPYVGAAFPKLKFHSESVGPLEVAGAGVTETTAPLCSMDSVIANDFKNELPTIVTKTVASTITKAVKSYVANEAARQSGNGYVELFTKLANVAYDAANNIADLRTWTTLPREYQICRMATPADRKLTLRCGGASTDVALGDGVINVVFAKCITAQTPLQVNQLKLSSQVRPQTAASAQ